MRFLCVNMILAIVLSGTVQAGSITEVAQAVIEKIDDKLTYQVTETPKLEKLPRDVEIADKIHTALAFTTGVLRLKAMVESKDGRFAQARDGMNLVTSIISSYITDRIAKGLVNGRLPKKLLLVPESIQKIGIFWSLINQSINIPEEWAENFREGLTNMVVKAVQYTNSSEEDKEDLKRELNSEEFKASFKEHQSITIRGHIIKGYIISNISLGMQYAFLKNLELEIKSQEPGIWKWGAAFYKAGLILDSALGVGVVAVEWALGKSPETYILLEIVSLCHNLVSNYLRFRVGGLASK